jgi:hypothetical protein
MDFFETAELVTGPAFLFLNDPGARECKPNSTTPGR